MQLAGEEPVLLDCSAQCIENITYYLLATNAHALTISHCRRSRMGRINRRRASPYCWEAGSKTGVHPAACPGVLPPCIK